jgi:hypothetical protein
MIQIITEIINKLKRFLLGKELLCVYINRIISFLKMRKIIMFYSTKIKRKENINIIMVIIYKMEIRVKSTEVINKIKLYKNIFIC